MASLNRSKKFKDELSQKKELQRLDRRRRIEENAQQTQVDSNTSRISQNETDIATNEQDLIDHEADIAPHFPFALSNRDTDLSIPAGYILLFVASLGLAGDGEITGEGDIVEID